jgi:hypothetical protein
MSGPLLHARCRRLLVAAAVPAAGAVVAGLATDEQTAALGVGAVLLLAVGAGAAGLDGPDADLDTAGARPWPPWRAAHLVLLTGYATALCWLIDVGHGSPLPVALIVRDAAGLMGLLGIGVVLLGSRLGWAPAFASAVLALSPASEEVPLAGWLTQPVDSVQAALTATAAAAIGLVGYAAWGAHGRG